MMMRSALHHEMHFIKPRHGVRVNPWFNKPESNKNQDKGEDVVGAQHLIPEHASYQGNDWQLIETAMEPRLHARGEALFSVGNGFIGLRGVFEEAFAGDESDDAVFLNGVYETVPITYYEKAEGFAEASDVRPPAPNALPIDIWVDDAPFSLSTGKVLNYSRILDFKQGAMRREIEWRAPSGATLKLIFERLTSFTRPNLAAVRLSIISDRDCDIRVRSRLSKPLGSTAPKDTGEGPHDPRISPAFKDSPWTDFQDISTAHVKGFSLTTKVSGVGLASAIAHQVKGGSASLSNADLGDTSVGQELSCRLQAGKDFSLTKFIAYAATTEKRDEPIAERAQEILSEALAVDFNTLLDEQQQFLAQFWNGADCKIRGDERLNTALKFSAFHILQACGRDDETSIGAKGQTGEGYEGHFFWDAEIFNLPLMIYTAPDVARAMLTYRYRKLDAARENARIQGHKSGALFPWRTISGRECSAYFPAGTAQYHIIADIAYAITHYVDVTGDDDFLIHYGAEILMETARIWLDIGFFNDRRDGAFCINEVTGPDEYTALVNNNLYTNVMARAHLLSAVQAAEKLEREAPTQFKALAQKIGLSNAERMQWQSAAEKMYLPYDKDLQLYLQDDSFLEKKVWDFSATPQEHYPLLLYYPPMTIYRHQVCKQADAVLAVFLQEDSFEGQDRKRVFDYYEGVTVHDSTLSPCVFSIVAAGIGDMDKALHYFAQSALVDIEDLHGNAAHGVHMAASGGTWMALCFGFAGMREHKGTLSFAPRIPKDWQGYDFRLRFQGRILDIKVNADTTSYRLISGEPLTIRHHASAVRVSAEAVQLPTSKKANNAA